MARKRKNPVKFRQSPEDARLEEMERELDREGYSGSPLTKYRYVGSKRRLTTKELGRIV